MVYVHVEINVLRIQEIKFFTKALSLSIMLYAVFFGEEILSIFDHMSFHLCISAFNPVLHTEIV